MHIHLNHGIAFQHRADTRDLGPATKDVKAGEQEHFSVMGDRPDSSPRVSLPERPDAVALSGDRELPSPDRMSLNIGVNDWVREATSMTGVVVSREGDNVRHVTVVDSDATNTDGYGNLAVTGGVTEDGDRFLRIDNVVIGGENVASITLLGEKSSEAPYERALTTEDDQVMAVGVTDIEGKFAVRAEGPRANRDAAPRVDEWIIA